MNDLKPLFRKSTPLLLAVGCWLALCGCVYDVPITEKPTRTLDAQFLGNWTSQDGKTKMKVSQYDEYNYVVIYDGDLFRAWSSDVGGTPFFSVKNLDSTDAGSYGKFYYSVWKLAGDGTLHARLVNDKIVPDATKDSASVRQLLKANLQNPDLLAGDEAVFVRDK